MTTDTTSTFLAPLQKSSDQSTAKSGALGLAEAIISCMMSGGKTAEAITSNSGGAA